MYMGTSKYTRIRPRKLCCSCCVLRVSPVMFALRPLTKAWSAYLLNGVSRSSNMTLASALSPHQARSTFNVWMWQCLLAVSCWSICSPGLDSMLCSTRTLNRLSASCLQTFQAVQSFVTAPSKNHACECGVDFPAFDTGDNLPCG